MVLSTMTSILAGRLGDKEALRIIAEAGFDAYDYSVYRFKDDSIVYGEDYKAYVAEIKAAAKEYGLICNQSHATFPSAKWGEEEYNEKTFRRIVRDMEIASMLGAKNIVVHSIKDLPEGVDPWAVNMEFFNRLLPYCKKFGIKVALENLFERNKKRGCIVAGVCGFGAEFVDYLDHLDPDWFVACLDIGHSGLVGDEAYKAIRVLGNKRLQALHVHDNDYKDDRHTIPFLGLVEWDKVTQALAQIGYEGDFTFEADSFLKGFPDDFLPEAESFMCKVGRYLISQIERQMQEDASAR